MVQTGFQPCLIKYPCSYRFLQFPGRFSEISGLEEAVGKIRFELGRTRLFSDWLPAKDVDSSIAAALIQFAVFFLPAKPVDVMSDGRTYDFVLAPRCPDPDFMAIRLGRPPPYVLLARISNLIINEVRGINRAVYDI